MRIALSIHHVARPGAGAPGATLALADALRRRGHEVTVLDFSLVRGGSERVATALAYPHALRRRLLARAGEFDVVDASTGDLAYVPRSGALRRASVLVTRSHGLEHLVVAARRAANRRGEVDLRARYRLYHGGLRLVEVRRSVVRADATFVLSSVEADLVASFGVSPSRILTTTNGVDAVLLASSSVAPPTPLVVLLGDASWRKGTDVALDALRQVIAAHPGTTVRWLGAGPSGAPAVAAAGLSGSVEVIERYEPAELPELLGPASVALSCARLEGMPIALLEAAALGVPVVASAIPGITDLVGTSGGGRLCPVDDAEAFAHAIGEVLQSPALRATLSANARRDAEDRTWDAIAANTEAHYRHLLDEATP